MIAWNLTFCDFKGCTHPVAYHCGCRRCDRDEAFFACASHHREVGVKHERVYRRAAFWCSGYAAVRALYLESLGRS